MFQNVVKCLKAGAPEGRRHAVWAKGKMEDSLQQLHPSEQGIVSPLRITVAPNGARRNRDNHPQLPVNLAQIVDCAEKCWQAGAHEIHLHVRDDEGRHSLSADTYRRTMDAIGDRVPNMDIQVTTEAAGRYDVAEQFALLQDLKPRAASIAIRESMREPDLVAPLYAFATEAQIKVQHILYDLDDLAQLRRQFDEAAIPAHMRDVLLVFGAYSPERLAQPEEVEPFVQALGDDFPNWTICAFGQHENAVAQEAIRLGGHIRIGFENNIQRPDGSLATDNAENIALALKSAQTLNRSILQRSQ